MITKIDWSGRSHDFTKLEQKYLLNVILFSLFRNLPITMTIIIYSTDRVLAIIQSLDIKGMA